ncbi:MAG: protein translocase subunit SecD [Acidimicrobiia bacterium]|nr:protein translocase subunit SecD [Acidimicrobiia bacterium]
MGRRGPLSAILTVVVAVGALAATFAFGNSPLLGLDLQGGVSVVLQPVDEVEDDQLDQAIEIIRNRVDSLGVVEPEITRQGDTILVQIPGVDDQDRALELVGQTAELRFRPVLGVVPEDFDPSDVTTTTAPSGEGGTTTTSPGDGGGTTVAPDATVAPGGGEDPGADESGLGPIAPGESAAARCPRRPGSAPTSGPDSGGDTTGSTAPAGETPPATVPAPPQVPTDPSELEVTPPEEDEAEEPVVLPGETDGETFLYSLGPAALTGEALEGASAGLSPGTGQWLVRPTFKAGEDGIDQFNAIAAQCVSRAPECPTGQLAITLDGEVISAPAIQQPNFQRDEIQITGDFDEGEANDLALVLRYGALPVELEPQQVQVVSATIGDDALRAGVIAGLIGLVGVVLYMLVFYRLLGLVALASLVVSGSFLWALIAYLGESQGLALTLAGVTGIIVSIGVALDSNVVYYEHVKEDVHSGRTVRSAVERSFQRAFSTIVKADVASLIGAGLLYWLTVGPVRGFALYLGLATILDLVTSWFFMRPAVIWLGRTNLIRERPSLLGLGGDETDEVGAPSPVGAG